jgi:hypothetical protein
MWAIHHLYFGRIERVKAAVLGQKSEAVAVLATGQLPQKDADTVPLHVPILCCTFLQYLNYQND